LFKLYEKNFKKQPNEDLKNWRSFSLVIYHHVYLITNYIFFLLENSRSIYLLSENIKLLTKISKQLKEYAEFSDKNINIVVEEDQFYKEISNRIQNSQSVIDYQKEKEFFIECEMANYNADKAEEEIKIKPYYKLNMLMLFRQFWRKTFVLKEINTKSLLFEYTHLMDVFVTQTLV
jgi:hypothetical protein